MKFINCSRWPDLRNGDILKLTWNMMDLQPFHHLHHHLHAFISTTTQYHNFILINTIAYIPYSLQAHSLQAQEWQKRMIPYLHTNALHAYTEAFPTYTNKATETHSLCKNLQKPTQKPAFRTQKPTHKVKPTQKPTQRRIKKKNTETCVPYVAGKEKCPAGHKGGCEFGGTAPKIIDKCGGRSANLVKGSRF
jgi:hypothetical protein